VLPEVPVYAKLPEQSQQGPTEQSHASWSESAKEENTSLEFGLRLPDS
jgi:hypothetical protein